MYIARDVLPVRGANGLKGFELSVRSRVGGVRISPDAVYTHRTPRNRRRVVRVINSRLRRRAGAAVVRAMIWRANATTTTAE